MGKLRPSDKELRYVGFTELERILLKDQSDEVVREAYHAQLEMLMSDTDDQVEF